MGVTAKEEDMETTEPRPLADEVAEVVLDCAQEWLKYWPLDNGTQVRTTWHASDHLSIHEDGGPHLGDFQVKVTARPIPLEPVGPEEDGATQAELAAAHRHATEPQPALGGKSPADLILEVLEAAQEVVDRDGFGTIFPGPRASLHDALLRLRVALVAEALVAGQEEAGHWEPATWASVKNGDRVRIGQAEAAVEVALPLTSVSSGATVVQVKLMGREAPYTMPPSGPVEVWRPSLPDWAAQAYLTLAEAKMTEVASHG